MDPRVIAVFIPMVAVGGFFLWMIALVASKAYQARLKAEAGRVGAAEASGSQAEVLAALDEVRREVAELAERVDFTERLLAKPRDAAAGKPLPGERRTAST